MKFKGLCNMCFDMKKNTLESILECLDKEKVEVTVNPQTSKLAGKAFDRMFQLMG